MLDKVIAATKSFVNSVRKGERKKYGQFFTAESSARFMASMFNIDMSLPEINILDAGAGTGVLSIALIERLLTEGYQGEITLTCYENDPKVMRVLAENLTILKAYDNIRYRLSSDNYITTQQFNRETSFVFDDRNSYHLVIGNPPYLKIGKDAPEAIAMQEVCHGAPNLYFLFMAMGIYNLAQGGELVYIIPRSWTSGAYFGQFRKYLFRECVIEHIHLFESRDKVFDSDPVLQETMIVQVKKSDVQPSQISITTSLSSDFTCLNKISIDYNKVVSENNYVYLVTNKEQETVMSRIGKLHETLESLRMKMKTGLIVDFRTREVLRDFPEDGACPLFYAQHIRNGKVIWPQGRAGEYILTERQSYRQKNVNYLFVKRFTSKEESRRLQCGVYLARDFCEYPYVSTHNKINFIECESEFIAYGLYALFGSTLYDDYYRILNGSTQVNATEMNTIPIPGKKIIEWMGREMSLLELSEENCNQIVNKWIR